MDPKPLWDRESELAVLGAALFGRVAPLSPDDFNDTRIRRLWPEILAAYAEGKTLQMEQVMDMVPMADQQMVTQAASATVLTMAEYHAERVADFSQRRQLLQAANDVAKGIYSGTSLDEIRAAGVEALSRVGPIHDGARRIYVTRVFDEYWEALGNPRDTWGLVTSIPQIDIELGGLHEKETFVLAGEPGVGKTIWVTQLGFMLAGLDYLTPRSPVTRQANPGAFYELEMSADAIIRRAACGLARLNARKVRTGRMSTEEQGRFMDALETVRKAPVFISDRTDWTSRTMRADAIRLMREEGIKWVVVDYTGLLKDPADNDVSKEMAISQAMSDLAKEGLAVVLVETLNKGGLRGDESQGAVRGSVQKMYDASVVAFLQFDRTNGAGDQTGNKRCYLRLKKAREADIALRVPLLLVGSQKRFEYVQPTQGGVR